MLKFTVLIMLNVFWFLDDSGGVVSVLSASTTRFIGSKAATSTTISTTTRSPKEKFESYLNSIQKSNKDDSYYCTTHLSDMKKSVNWVLRNKKCLSFNSSSRLNFYDAYDYCSRRIPFSRGHLMHRDELDALLSNRHDPSKGLDVLALYATLSTEFSFWLNENDYTICSNRSNAPVFIYNQNRCQNGCYECAPKLVGTRYAVCVKACEWRVDINSYCNTMKTTTTNTTNNTTKAATKKSEIITTSEIIITSTASTYNYAYNEIEANLYVQREYQIYLCKGELLCVDNVCQCPRGKRYVKDKSKCV